MRNQNPQTCIWTGLLALQCGIEQFTGTLFLKESNLDQYLQKYSSSRWSSGRNFSQILALQKAVYVLGNCIEVFLDATSLAYDFPLCLACRKLKTEFTTGPTGRPVFLK